MSYLPGGVITTDSRLSDARTPLAHTHVESDVTGLVTDLAAKEATANKGVAGGYASLDGATKLPIAQVPTGSTGSTVPFGNDARLSDARTPLAHTHPESDVVGLVTDLAGKSPTPGAVQSKTANYTVLTTDDWVKVDASGGAITVTLPDATLCGNPMPPKTIKKVGGVSLNLVTIATQLGQTIDGVTSVAISALWGSLSFRSDGANWFQV